MQNGTGYVYLPHGYEAPGAETFLGPYWSGICNCALGIICLLPDCPTQQICPFVKEAMKVNYRKATNCIYPQKC